jgi:1-acyl-sn-glycerol-3-phosphate acyltransferase
MSAAPRWRRGLGDRIGKTAASYALWAIIMLTCPIFFIGALLVWAVTVPFDRRLRALHLYSCAWASFYSYIFPFWSVRVRGRARLRDAGAVVIISNHQSLVDILVLFRLYTHYKWVSKSEIFRLPFVGWNMALNRYIRIRRGDSADASRMMVCCGEALESGSSVMMFPEGTRSPDGEIRSFKHGAFTLAVRHHVPIVPIVIDGTLDALPKYGLTMRDAAKIRIEVLDPIDPARFPTVDALKDHVHEVMIDALAAMRGHTHVVTRSA